MKLEKLKQLSYMDEIRISSSYKEFWLREAWHLTTPAKGACVESEVIDYFIRKAIGMGLPYDARFLKFCVDAGDGPGALIQLTVGDFRSHTILLYTDIVAKRSRSLSMIQAKYTRRM